MRRGPAVVAAAAAIAILASGCGGTDGARNGGDADSKDSTAEPGPEASEESSTVTRRARLQIGSAPVAQSADRRDLLTPAVARFRPAAEGSQARVERRTGGGSWAPVEDAVGVEDAEGVVRFQLPRVKPGDEGAYRVVGDGATSRSVRPEAQIQVFVEEFDDPGAFDRRWAVRDLGQYYGRRMCASPSPDRIALEDGVATLSVKRVAPDGAVSPGDSSVECVGGVWANAMVGTGRATEPFEFTYGTAAARIKVQQGQGMHAAFWMQSMGDGGLEIDTAEYYGDGHDAGLTSKIHDQLAEADLATEGGTVDLSDVLEEGRTPSDGFHVYSVDWSPEGYVFRVDGVVTLRTDEPRVADGPEEVILSLLTSDWALDDGTTSEDSTVEVDWVRVWQDEDHVGQ